MINAIDDTLYASLGGNEPSFRYIDQESVLEVPDLRSRSRILPEDRSDVEVTGKIKKKRWFSIICSYVYEIMHWIWGSIFKN